MQDLRFGTASNLSCGRRVYLPEANCLFLTESIETMKTLFAAFAFALLSAGAFAQTDANFNLEINGETSREDLMNMRTELLDKGFDFRYTPQFDNDLKLVSITVHMVELEGERKGSYKSTQLQAGQVVRLINSTDPNAAVPFCVGNCPG